MEEFEPKTPSEHAASLLAHLSAFGGSIPVPPTKRARGRLESDWTVKTSPDREPCDTHDVHLAGTRAFEQYAGSWLSNCPALSDSMQQVIMALRLSEVRFSPLMRGYAPLGADGPVYLESYFVDGSERLREALERVEEGYLPPEDVVTDFFRALRGVQACAYNLLLLHAGLPAQALPLDPMEPVPEPFPEYSSLDADVSKFSTKIFRNEFLAEPSIAEQVRQRVSERMRDHIDQQMLNQLTRDAANTVNPLNPSKGPGDG